MILHYIYIYCNFVCVFLNVVLVTEWKDPEFVCVYLQFVSISVRILFLKAVFDAKGPCLPCHVDSSHFLLSWVHQLFAITIFIFIDFIVVHRMPNHGGTGCPHGVAKHQLMVPRPRHCIIQPDVTALAALVDGASRQRILDMHWCCPCIQNTVHPCSTLHKPVADALWIKGSDVDCECENWGLTEQRPASCAGSRIKVWRWGYDTIWHDASGDR